jgi:hypothetical protein
LLWVDAKKETKIIEGQATPNVKKMLQSTYTSLINILVMWKVMW